MKDIQIFNNPEFGEVRTVVIDDEPWFVGKDVATALGYENPQKALRDHVDNEDKKMGERNVTPSIKDSLGREHLKKGIVAIAITGAVLLSLGAYSGDQKLVEDSYTVQKGDTLWSISETYLKKNTGGRRYILEFQEGIKELNPWLLDTRGQVQPGQVLRINYWIKKGEQTD